MSHFYAEINTPGHKPTYKGSTAKAGMTAHVRGWDVGVFVELYHKDGVDVIRLWRTGGSNAPDSVGEPIETIFHTQEVKNDNPNSSGI